MRARPLPEARSMSYGLRSIAFVAELIHPPVQHQPQALQKLHGDLFGSAACSYKDFRLVPGGAQLSNALGGAPGAPVSCTNLLADRVQIREEQTGISREDFKGRVETLASEALATLPINLYVAQQFAVRSVVSVHGSPDTRQFMLRTLFGFDEEVLHPLGADPTLAGLRLAFPPDQVHGGIFNVRVESFTLDNRSLFLENVGTFGKPVAATGAGEQGLDELGERFERTYEFLQDQLAGFVAQFDAEEQG